MDGWWLLRLAEWLLQHHIAAVSPAPQLPCPSQSPTWSTLFMKQVLPRLLRPLRPLGSPSGGMQLLGTACERSAGGLLVSKSRGELVVWWCASWCVGAPGAANGRRPAGRALPLRCMHKQEPGRCMPMVQRVQVLSAGCCRRAAGRLD